MPSGAGITVSVFLNTPLLEASLRNGLISSSIQSDLPNVAITRSASLSCITMSYVETEGYPFVHCCQVVPLSRLTHNPCSVPAKIKLGSAGSCNTHNA